MFITVIGATFVDIKGYPDAVFLPKGRNAGRVEQVHGGVCRNIAEDLANIGLPSAFVSLVDGSGTGTDVIDRLRTKGVETRYLRRTPDGMGTWLAVFDHTGDVFAAISKRPDLSPIADLLDREGDELIRSSRSILMEADIEEEISERVLTLAQKYERPVYACVSNMSIAQRRRELIRRVDCFVCNRSEAGIFFAEEVDDLDPEQIRVFLAQQIARAGLKRMVVTLGAEGSVWAENGGESGVCHATPARVKDTTGAGDAYFAGVAGALSCGLDLKEACSVGSRLASGVLESTENVCPRFKPEEFGLSLPREGIV